MEFPMVYKSPSAPDPRSTRPVEHPRGNRREDGEADVIDVPQADGDSGDKPEEAGRAVEKPAKRG